MLILLALSAPAATLDVGPADPYTAIEEAVRAAEDGDTLRIAPGRYDTFVWVHTKRLELEPRDGPGTVTLVGDPRNGFSFLVEDTGQLVIRDVVIEGGPSGDELFLVDGDGRLELRDVTVRGGASVASGGCLSIDDDASVHLTRVVFESCEAPRGNAAALLGGTLRSAGSTWTGMVGADEGGAIVVEGGDATFSGDRFEGNQALLGGAIHYAAYGNVGASTVTLQGCTFVGNGSGEEPTGVGGAVYTNADSSLIVEGSRFCDNRAILGGGLYHGAASLQLHHSSFLANVADDGAALFADDGTASHLLVGAHAGPGAAVGSGGNLGLSWSALWANDGGNTLDVLEGDGVLHGLDPGLDGSCEALDSFLPSGSPAIDAGDPSVTDPDGSVADLGAFGGPFGPGDTDSDGDGFPASLDCDDGDPTVFPTAPEVAADGIDQDCDGVDTCYRDRDWDGFGSHGLVAATTDDCSGNGESPTPDDCDDDDPAAFPDGHTLYEDLDGDGFGAVMIGTVCDPAGATVAAGDCDDDDPDVHPDAAEDCTFPDEDRDCDGIPAGSDYPVDNALLLYRDADGDGFGDFADLELACDADEGWVLDATDCDDTRPDVNPGAVEVCDPDDVDEDCSGAADNLDPLAEGRTTFYRDNDRDGYGAQEALACDPAPGLVLDAGDCDDARAWVNPGGTEVCDPDDVDEDCDGRADEVQLGTCPTATPTATDDTAQYIMVEGEGCGCRSAVGPAGGLPLLLLLPWMRRRRC